MIKQITNVKIGADPELFLRDLKSGEFIPSIGLIGGSKEEPKPIDDEGYFVQEDNVAVEFNIPPAKSEKEFVASIQKVIGYLTAEVGKIGLSLECKPSALFLPKHLTSKKAQEFGCEPDMNCWTGEENPRPRGPKNLRSCGGHVHIGWDNPNFTQRIAVAKAADLFIGTLSAIHDDDNRRRKLYGKAGACRLKDYGIEHRTSSNYWLQSEELTALVFRQAQKAVEFVNSGYSIAQKDEQMIQDCINGANKQLFSELNHYYRIL